MAESNKICRACLDTSERFTYILHKNVPHEIFLFCTTVEVLHNDNLPKSLCDVCYDILNKFSEFKHLCIQSNETLKSIYNDTKDSITPNIDIDELEISDLELKEEPEHFDKDNDGTQCENNDIKEKLNDNNIRTLLDKNKIKSKSKPALKSARAKPTVPKVFNLSCDHCNRKFQNEDRFEAHKLGHQGISTKIECNICHKVYSKWQSLVQHKANRHTIVNLSSLQCAECGQVCKTIQTLQHHEQTHRDSCPIVCDICGKEYKSKRVLKTHLETHKKNRLRLHSCDQCGSKYFSVTALSNHIHRRHKGRRYICHHCDYPFRDKYNLIQHLMVKHEGRNPFKCDICSKSFKNSSSLRIHKRYHSGERPYECEVCMKLFVTKSMMIEHQRIHTGEKPFKCTLCAQAFTQKGSLNRHSKVHDKPVQLRSKVCI